MPLPTAFAPSEVILREVDLSEIIANVSTSVGAMVFVSKKGPTDITLTTSTKEFTDTYGDPDAKVSLAHYCALGYLEESTRLQCIRVTAEDAMYSGVMLRYRSGALSMNNIGVSDPENIDFSTADGATGIHDNIAYFYARGPGEYGNSIGIDMVSDNLTAPTPTAAASTTGGTFSAGTKYYRVTAFNRLGEKVPGPYVQVDTTGSTGSVTLSWNAIAGASGYKVYGRAVDNFQLIATVEGSETSYTDTGIAIAANAPTPPTTDPEIDQEVRIRVYDNDLNPSSPIEEFICTFEPTADGFGAQLELEDKINGNSEYIRVANNALNWTNTVPAPTSLAKVTFEGGADGSTPTSSQIARAWDRFDDVEQINVNVLMSGGYTDVTILQKIDAVANKRKDAIGILDVPSNSQNPAAAVNFRNLLNLNSSRSLLYAPDIRVKDTATDRIIYIPPSGHVGQRIAYTDRVEGPSRSFAGLNRGIIRVLGLRHLYNSGQRQTLSESQVNYIRSVEGAGVTVWEQWTLQNKLSALSFGSVRRITDVLEKSISQSLLYGLQEPNDDFLAARIISAIRRYMDTLVYNRDIQPGFTVISDRTNNPPNVLGAGQRNVHVYFTPTLPANRIELTVVLTRQGADISALLAA